MTVRVRGLGEIADRFDVALVDQFGVLHNGQTPYPEARNALLQLRDSGLRVVLLSNSGKRADANAERLARFGFGPECFDLLVTSGEVAHAMIADRRAGVERGARCLVIARGGGGEAALDGLGLRFTTNASEAELVVIAGAETERIPLDDYAAMLRPAAERSVRALCTNPDRHMLTETGIRPGAGAIAERYAAMGGEVTWIGKPYAAIYEHVARTLGNVEWPRTMAVGDSREHDIAGVQAMGGRGVLVETGVANADEGTADGGSEPDFVIDTMRF